MFKERKNYTQKPRAVCCRNDQSKKGKPVSAPPQIRSPIHTALWISEIPSQRVPSETSTKPLKSSIPQARHKQIIPKLSNVANSNKQNLEGERANKSENSLLKNYN